MRKFGPVLLLALVLGCESEMRGSAQPATSAEPLAVLDDITNGLDVVPSGGFGFGLFEAEKSKSEPVRTWKRSRLVPNTTKLSVGEDDDLPLEGLEATVRIDGFRARVVLDCLYRNTHEQRLEGTFRLRLPTGASPYFFAFGATVAEARIPDGSQWEDAVSPEEILAAREQVWSEPKEARIVPRERAAWAYGEETRRKVDPALMEWSGAGVFASRVFPLEPKTVHRIVIGYEMNLFPVGDELEFRLDLPTGLPKRSVAVTVATGEGMKLHRFETPDRPTVTLRLPSPKALLLVGEDERLGPHFAARITPDLPEAPAASRERAVFLVDVSLSSNPERMNVWLSLLTAILEKNRDTLREFAVLFFNVEAFWWKEGFVPNDPENGAALLAFANRLALEGATDLGAAVRSVLDADWAKGKRPDLFLLSDGAATWGADAPEDLADRLADAGTGGLFAYRTGLQGTDTTALLTLARATGGAVFAVAGEAELGRAATAHRKRPWRIGSVSVPGGKDLLILGDPGSLYPGQSLIIAGRGRPEASAKIGLALRQDSEEHAVALTPDRVIDSDLAPRVYGQIATARLERLGVGETAKAYATHFRIVGGTCSLVMLESEADYQRYGIKPEANAYVVEKEPVGAVAGRIRSARAEERGSAKAAFVADLRRLESMPGMKFKVPRALELALDEMPEEAFVVVPPPLVCRARTWGDVPGPLQEALASHELPYDLVTGEAERRRRKLGTADALKVLSSLVEVRPGDAATARDVGYSAMEMGEFLPAYVLFRRVARSRPHEPETYRAMARCLEEAGRIDLAIAWYEVALAGEWAARFGEFRRIAAMDYARLLRQVREGRVRSSVRDFAISRVSTFEQDVAGGRPGLVVTITWNTDRTDVDLHVTDPKGEKCYYKHTETRMGGRITQDVTQGYGPEMFLVPKPVAGKYEVDVHYYTSDTSRTSLRTRVFVTIYEGWGTPMERLTRKVVKLDKGKELHRVATVFVR